MLVVAVGNRLRRDDGVGPEVADRLPQTIAAPAAIVHSDDVLSLVDRWAGEDLVIAIDAVRSGAPPGTLYQIDATTTPLPAEWSFASSHQVGLAHAVEFSRALNRLPARLIVVGIEAGDFDHGTGLSPEVAAAVPAAAATVARYLPGAFPSPCR
jgi:hydrogenase maturation protease